MELYCSAAVVGKASPVAVHQRKSLRMDLNSETFGKLAAAEVEMVLESRILRQVQSGSKRQTDRSLVSLKLEEAVVEAFCLVLEVWPSYVPQSRRGVMAQEYLADTSVTSNITTQKSETY